MKKRILFVDDDLFILQGLQRMLRGMREEWEMEFVDGGAAALSRLERTPFDVVVSDMKMPGMNGAELLNEVMRRHPRSVRLILSGHADRDLILRCVGSTHQYLSKPCDAGVLKATVARATALEDIFSNAELRGLVARIDTLPSLPSLYLRMMECLQSQDVSMVDVGEIIEQDIAMTAKILKIVNSAFFGMPRQITSAAEAASFLGADILKALVLSAHLFAHDDVGGTGRKFAEALWTHSLKVAAAAKAIAQAEETEDHVVSEAFVAGMLHDIGKLVLMANFPEEYRRVRTSPLPTWQAEREAFGASHAEIGGYLLGLWGLPAPVVQAVTLHHTMAADMGASFGALIAVHVADGLVHLAGTPSALDPETVKVLGLEGRLLTWQRAVQKSPAQAR